MPAASILFDRDGTLIEDRHYLSDPKGVVLLPGVGQALFQLRRGGARLFMVSNQSGIGRGFFSHDAAEACNSRLQGLLGDYEATLEEMLYCPHAPEAQCPCRKPAPGMWQDLCARAAKCAPLHAESTIMVGDKAEDLMFAANAGLFASILVLTGKGKATCERLGLASDEPCMLYPQETRPGYPTAVIKDCTSLVEAVVSIGRLMDERQTKDGAREGV